MRRIVIYFSIVNCILMTSMSVANACGDKSLRIGRGVRFQRTGHPASILIYIPSTAPGNVARVDPLRTLLKKAGHKTARTVLGVDQLDEALRSGHYDLVLSSLTEAGGLQSHIASSQSRPVLVAVAPSKVPKAEVRAAERQYKYIVKDSGNPEQYLTAVEQAMKARQAVQAKA
jgi:hypothetical protein